MPPCSTAHWPAGHRMIRFVVPPLQYWATTLAYRLFGVHEWTARLWSALAGLLCVASVWYAALRVRGDC